RRLRAAQSDLDHRILGCRSFEHASVQLEVIRLGEWLGAGRGHPNDRRPVEHDGDALRRIRRAAHAGLPELPVGDEARRLSGLGNAERAGEFADQQGRLIDLCGDEDAGGLDVELRSYLRELGTREVATYLDAERKAAQRLLAAGVDTADLG